ncbi:MAG: sigma-70 family RNA polymerase sigma factor [Microbacterium sp.]
MRTDEPRHPHSTADADLILRTRSGDGGAFGELWRRHYPSGMSVARSITSSIDPDDLVQESFTRIYQAVLKGGGPNGSFRAYLFTSIRNTAAAWGRSRRETAMDELDTVPDPDSTEQAASEALDRGLTAQAFRSLPTRWQEVLWYTEIEQMKPGEVAPLLGMKAGAVSQLSFRAREGLREAWIQAHLRSTGADSECHWTIEHLGAHSRRNLSTRDRKRVDAHLDDCARCLIVAGEAKDVSSRLALVLLPLVLGVSGATGYAALLQSGGATAVAVAAMPSSVVAGEGLVGLPVGVDGTSAAGGAGGAGGTSGGAITGLGALVGAGSAALVVAGVVAAATIVPGLVNASPVTSLPNAGDADDSSISSDVSPDNGIDSTEKPLLKVPEDAPEEKDDEGRAPETSPPVAPPVADEVLEIPAETPAGEGGGNDAGQEEDNGGEDTGGGDEGQEPGPGPEEPEEPAPEPSLPQGKPTVESATVKVSWWEWEVDYTVQLSGVADATVRAVIDDDAGTAQEVTLAADSASGLSTSSAAGSGTVTISPTRGQLCDDDTEVDFSYVLDDEVGDAESILLSELAEFPYPKLLEIVCALNISFAAAAAEDATIASVAPTGPAEEAARPTEQAVGTEDELTEEPVTEEPAPEEPQAEEPVTEEPVAEEPVVEAAPETVQPTEQSVETPAEGTAATEDTAPAE